MGRLMNLWETTLLLVLSLSLMWLPAQAKTVTVAPPERAYDGAAKAWVNGGRLCLGLEPSYEAGGLMVDAANVAQHEVMLNALLVHKDQQVVWQAHAPKLGAATLAVRSDTCLPYGQTPAAMTEVIPAQPLSPGLYTVMLVGNDEQNRRAWFYQHFCVGPDVNRLRVTAATFSGASQRWQCG